MAVLYVMVGIPGSGKSTFITNHIKSENQIHVSRDTIRFSLVAEDEEYFSKEKEVFKTFIQLINDNLTKGLDVYADATHLNEASRNKLLRSITAKPSSVDCIFMRTPLETALERNDSRKRTRSYVPEAQIRDMSKRLTNPSFDEGFNKIYIIEPTNDNYSIKIYENI